MKGPKTLKVFKLLRLAKKELHGTKELNKKIQELVNPKVKGKLEKQVRRKCFSRGRCCNADEE